MLNALTLIAIGNYTSVQAIIEQMLNKHVKIDSPGKFVQVKPPRTTHWTLTAGSGLAEIRRALGDHFSPSRVDTIERRIELLDTFGWNLWHRGMILCSTADGRLELYRDDGLLDFVEVGRRPRFWWDIPAGLIRQELESALGLWSLAPIAAVRHRRDRFAILNQDGKIIVRAEINDISLLPTPPHTERLDVVVANSGKVLTVRALRGYDNAASDVERCFWDLLAGPRVSASLRVLLSELGIEPNTVNAKLRFDLTPDTPAELAVRKMLEDILRHARVYEAGIVADRDTEFLHQYRVALRKGRALLSLMETALPGELYTRVKSELAALARETGPLRDLDVLLLQRQAYRDMLPEEFHPGLIQLDRLIARERTKALKAVLRSLTAPDYSGRFEDLMQHIAGPPAYKSEKASGQIEPLARRKIRRHYDKVSKRGAAINAQTPSEQVHELRIECKKLRYLLELFAELYPSAQIKPAVKSLKGLQDVLGNFNDYSVQQRFLLDLARRRKLAVDVLGAVSGLVAVLHQRRLTEQQKIQNAFASFQEPGTAELFNALAHPPSDGPVNL